ncbi:MAG: hypothetical protein AAB657_02700 [Patescibacteria group bacterium]
MYHIKTDKIFEPYVKTFNAGMLSLWAVGQPFFLDWVQQHDEMPLEAKSGQASSILVKPLVAEIKKNNLPDDKKGPFFTELIQNFCILFCIAAFDRLKEDERYKKIKGKPVVEFFRHLRHGCAHGNKFFFKTYKDKKTGKVIEEPTKMAKFKNMEITRDLMGKPENVFFDFFSAGDIPYLIEDISKELADQT